MSVQLPVLLSVRSSGLNDVTQFIMTVVPPVTSRFRTGSTVTTVSRFPYQETMRTSSYGKDLETKPTTYDIINMCKVVEMFHNRGEMCTLRLRVSPIY